MKTIDSFLSFHYSMAVIRNRFRAEILERPIGDNDKKTFLLSPVQFKFIFY